MAHLWDDSRIAVIRGKEGSGACSSCGSWLNRLGTSRREKLLTVAVTLLLLLLMVTLKLFYSNAEVEQLRWLLAPTVLLVKLFTATEFLFEAPRGYVAWGGAVVVGAGCAGLNFFIISLCMSFFTLLGRINRHPLLWLGGMVVLAYLLTLWVNTLRIVGALLLLRWAALSSVVLPPQWHSLQGSLFYFIFLVFYYLVLQHLSKRISE